MGRPDEFVDATNANADLDAQMRQITEMAVAGLQQMMARPETVQDPAEDADDHVDAGTSSVEGVADRQLWFVGCGGSGVYVASDGPFSPVYEEDAETGEATDVLAGFANCYWQNGGKTVLLADQTIPGTDGFIALRAGATPATTGQATLVCYPTLAALQAAQDEPAYFIVPLYRVADGRITLDMRRIPHIYLAEVL